MKILAKKVNMTQVWTASGKVVPVTVLRMAEKIEGLAAGAVVDIKGVSKGRGFAGAVKRHGFHGAPASHGHDHPRAVGSIGQRFPQHTRKGLRMAGHMGAANATVKHSVIVAIDEQQNLLLVKGGVPGHPNSIVEILDTGKKKEIGEIVKYGEPIKQEVKTEQPATEAPAPADQPQEVKE